MIPTLSQTLQYPCLIVAVVLLGLLGVTKAALAQDPDQMPLHWGDGITQPGEPSEDPERPGSSAGYLEPWTENPIPMPYSSPVGRFAQLTYEGFVYHFGGAYSTYAGDGTVYVGRAPFLDDELHSRTGDLETARRIHKDHIEKMMGSLGGHEERALDEVKTAVLRADLLVAQAWIEEGRRDEALNLLRSTRGKTSDDELKQEIDQKLGDYAKTDPTGSDLPLRPSPEH